MSSKKIINSMKLEYMNISNHENYFKITFCNYYFFSFEKLRLMERSE